MRTFEVDSTVRFLVKYKDFSGLKVDPTSPAITIVDSAGNIEVNAQTPTKEETGIYYYDWKPTEQDTYVVIFVGVIEGKTATGRNKFKVTKTELT